MDFHLRIRQLRKAKGLSQEELGKRFDVIKQTVSNWENGVSTPSYKVLIELADFFQVSIDFLLGYQIKNNVQQAQGEDTTKIPIYSPKSASEGFFSPTNIIGYEPVPQSYISGAEYFIAQMNDDSMIGLRIFKGDKLILRKQEFLTPDNIHLVQIANDKKPGEITTLLRKINDQGKKIDLIPANFDYTRIEVNKNEVTVLGELCYRNIAEV